MKTFSLLVCAVVSSSVAFGQDFDRIAPKQLPVQETTPPAGPPKPAPFKNVPETVLLRHLKAVVFVTKAASRKSLRGATGVSVRELPLLQTPAFTGQMNHYIGQPLTVGALTRIQSDVVQFYAAQDRPVVTTALPEQDITDGIVQIVVTEGRLGEVRVTGNRWFGASNFRSHVRLRDGEPIYKSRLEQDTRELNQNPFRSVDTVFSPGREPGLTDVEMRVQDRFPLRVYAGYENTGTRETDENRLVTGFNWGNAFGLDQQFNYQFTTSPDFHELLAHSASYLIPLPWHHTLTIFGSYAETTPELAQDFDLTGRTWQISARYGIPLPDIRSYTHELAFGFDFKSSNNNLGFGGTQVFDTSVDISQFVLAYRGALPDAWGKTLLNAEGYWSPGGIGSHNNDADFAATTPGASAKYVYGKLTVQRTTHLPANFSLVDSFTGQVSDGPLYASEQLGVGGYDTVRGYSERAANGDSGFLMSHEIRTPSLHPMSLVGITKVQDDLQFLAFWDYGIAHLREPTEGAPGSSHLSSLGLGLRYAINNNVAVRADYGWQLTRTIFDDDSGRFHVGVTISY